jgi:beta-glucosidase-like glycosyl hydrolase
MSEQTAREIYLKAFEIGCKSGDVPALMASYMWINGEWLGGDYSLLTNIVRNEWGFNGMITTDNAGQGGGYKWMSPSKMIYAGGDMVLANPAQKLDSSIKTSNEGISAMKTATKHILYTVAKAYLNRLEASRVGENTFIPIYIVINVVLFGGAAGCLIAEGVFVALYFANKKNTQPQSQQIQQQTNN